MEKISDKPECTDEDLMKLRAKASHKKYKTIFHILLITTAVYFITGEDDSEAQQ